MRADTAPDRQDAAAPAAAARGGPRAILVVRLSALGDVALSTAVLEPLRRAYPDAHVAWLVQPEAAPLVAGNPALDEVIELPRHEWARSLRRGRILRVAREAARLVHRLHAARFDLALDLQGLWKSAAWARLSGAPRRIGAGPREGSGVLLTERVQRPARPATPGVEYVPLLAALGAECREPRPAVVPADGDREAAARRLEAAGLAPGFVALCPFTTRPQKHWPPARWAELARALHREPGRPLVLLGGPGDRDAARAIAAAAGVPVTDWSGRTGIGEAAALLAHAGLVIGVDTGLTHLAAGQARPTVALFGSTRPYGEHPGLPLRVLRHDLPCAPCHRHPTCGGAYTCMHALGVAEVLAAARALLAADPLTAPAQVAPPAEAAPRG